MRWTWVVVCLLPTLLSAQSRASLDLELGQMQTSLNRNLVQRERLQDLYYRHSMGLGIAMDEFYALTKKEWQQSKDPLRQQLEGLRGKVANMVREHEALKKRFEEHGKARAVADAAAATPGKGDRFDPLGGSAGGVGSARSPTPHSGGRRVARGTKVEPSGRLHRPPRRAEKKKPRPVSKDAIALIKGSKNHSLVGRILFRAGKHEAAMRELLPLSKKSKPKFIDLFYLALSYEKLGHSKGEHAWFDKANDVFSKIEAMDSKDGPDGKSVSGKWAQAARTARQTMFWILDSGDWKPIRDVNKIQWRQSSESSSRSVKR